MKKKNPFVAGLLGGLFGPFGAFYFGRKIGLSLLLILIAYTIYRIIFPAWYSPMRWEFLIYMVCYGILFVVWASVFNSTQDNNDRERFSAMILGNCVMVLNVGVRGIADAIQSISAGKAAHILALLPRMAWDLFIGYGIVMGCMMLVFRERKKPFGVKERD